MTFRDELTSATDLDTTAGAGTAGVIINGARATWQDGQAGMGYLEAVSSSASVVGSKFHAVGSTGGNLSPEWSMTCEGLPAGGYQSVLTMTADTLRVSGPWQLDAAWSPLSLATGFAAFDAPNTPRLAHLSSGEVALEGIVKIASGTVAAGASAVVGNLPAALVPAVNVFRPVVILTSAGAWFAAAYLVISANSSSVAVYNTTAGAFGAGAAWTLGCQFTPGTTLHT